MRCRYNDMEIRKHLDVDTFSFPQGLSEFDALLLVADHKEFTTAHVHEKLWSLKKCKLVLDNTGIWEDLELASKGVEYHVAGDENWLE